MAKRLNPQETKPFQPIEAAFLKNLLAAPPDEAPAPEAKPQSSTATAVAEPEPARPARASEPEPRERKVVHMRDVPEPAPSRRVRPVSVPGGERLNKPLKIQLQPSERAELARIVNDLCATLGTQVSTSHVTRALLTVFRNAEEKILERAKQKGSLKRPANDDLTAIAVFEQELAKLLLGAIRNSPPLRE